MECRSGHAAPSADRRPQSPHARVIRFFKFAANFETDHRFFERQGTPGAIPSLVLLRSRMWPVGSASMPILRPGIFVPRARLGEAATSVIPRGRIIRARSPPFATAHAVYLPGLGSVN
jgi:hypothetical protein